MEKVLCYGSFFFIGVLSFVFAMEIVHNIRRVNASGQCVPGLGCLLLIVGGVLQMLVLYQISLGRWAAAGGTVLLCAVPGIVLGARRDPYQ